MFCAQSDMQIKRHSMGLTPMISSVQWVCSLNQSLIGQVLCDDSNVITPDAKGADHRVELEATTCPSQPQHHNTTRRPSKGSRADCVVYEAII